jgi:hypothetical protein
VCFQSRAQVEEFLQKSGWAPADAKYLDGQKLARKVGVSLSPDNIGFGKPKQISAKLLNLAVKE